MVEIGGERYLETTLPSHLKFDFLVMFSNSRFSILIHECEA